MDELNDILNGFKNPILIESVNDKLSNHPKRDENAILSAVRASVLTILSNDDTKHLERYKSTTRRFAYWFIMSAFASDSTPWIDEPKLTIRCAQALVYDYPQLAKRAGAFLK